MFLLLIAGAISNDAKAQMTQFHIGGGGNELATKICYLPADTSTIIAGYTYDIVTGAARNCQAIVMKVKNTTIVWQKTFGVPTKNNLIKDMIITQDNNIVVVGTVGGNGDIFADNTAAILKYNSTDGALMWQNCFRDAATTTGGELFLGVTELRDGTNRLVAVGSHNNTGPTAGSMVCVFQSTGTLIYNEVFDAPSGDEFQSVVTSAAGNSVYMSGEFVGNFKDGYVTSYTPGATSGVINWRQYFDFYLNGIFQDNFLTKIALSGPKLVVMGGSLKTYSTAFGSGQSLMTLNASDGTGAQIYGVQNSGVLYANAPAMAVVSPDHIWTVQSPSTAYYDATIWATGVSTDAVVTEITSLTAGTYNPPVRYTSSDVGQHNILDMQLNGGSLYMAGATNVTTGFGNNDIYYVNTSTNLSSTSHTCDTAHDNVVITPAPFTSTPPVFNQFTFTPVYSTVDTGTTHFDIGVLCGDMVIADTICNTLAMPDSLVACSGTAVTLPGTVSGGDPVLSYTWSPATGLSSSTVLHPTLTGAITGWYSLTVKSILPGTFASNGDFSGGVTGFTSGYTVEAPSPASLPGSYAVTTNPALYDAAFPAFGDHTTGTGDMMLVDGSTTAGVSFWCETVPVLANTDYVFSVWSALVQGPLPSVQLLINGTPVTSFVPSATAGAWVQYQVPWNSGVSTSANICMTDAVVLGPGNAFAIDDISFNRLCTVQDSVYVNVDFSDTVSTSSDSVFCFATSGTATITAPSGYSSYLWNIGNTTQSIAVPGGTYIVYCTNNCSTLADTFHVTLLNDTMTLYNPDTAICRGRSVAVRLTGNPILNYQWVPTAGIPASTLAAPVITPDTSAMYYVTASMPGCPDLVDSFYIDVQPTPVVFFGGNRSVCRYDTLHLHASVMPAWYTHYQYSWSPGTFLDDPTQPDIIFTAGDTTELILNVTTPAGCSSEDSALVIVHTASVLLDTNANICPGDSIQLNPTGATSYMWHPGLYLSDSTASHPWVHAITSQHYMVVSTDQYGCHDTSGATVYVRPNAVMFLTDSVTLYPGESYHIQPVTNCTYFTWFPPAGLDYDRISDPTANPQLETKYLVHAATEWGCKITDSINIRLDETVTGFPNAFTPGAGINNNLYLVKRGVATLNYLRIWNRWGNLVFETTDINQGWDGTYKGVPQPFGVYVYQLEGVTNAGRKFEKHGNVTLIR